MNITRHLLRVMAIAVFLGAGASNVQAVFFVDNFQNDNVADSDSYQGFWSAHAQTSAGSVLENVDNDNLLTFTISDANSVGQSASLYSGLRGEFDFFRATPITFTVRRLDMSGTAPAAHRVFRFDVLAETGPETSFDTVKDGFRIEVRADGNVFVYQKAAGIGSTIGTYRKAADVYPHFIRLNLKQRGRNSFQLKLYYPDAVASIETIAADHGIDKSDWGDGSGAAAIRLEAYRDGSAALSSKATITDVYVQDTPDNHVRTAPPPGVSPSDPWYAQHRMLNVKHAPYHCKGDGVTDDSIALQRAINDALEYNLAVYIPRGTYIVDRTLYFMQKIYLREAVTAADSELGRKIGLNLGNKVHTIVGERAPHRPVIKLATSASFENKALLSYWNQTYLEGPRVGTDNPDHFQANIGYNNTFKNLVVDVSGIPGAVGIRGSMAQGTTFQDIKVIATGAKAGFHRLCGVAGGYYNIEVEGGEYGIYLPRTNDPRDVQYPTMNGLVLKNQSVSAILLDNGSHPLTIAGFRIQKRSAPAITLGGAHHLSGSSITAVGGIVEFTEPGQMEVVENANHRVCYLRDVYVKHAKLVSAKGAAPLNGAGWSHIREYAFNGHNAVNVSHSILDGVVVSAKGAETVKETVTSGVQPPVDDIVRRHIWDALTFPDFTDPDVRNIKEDFGAKGDGETDDYDAFVKAIAQAEKIYVPSGRYHCRAPLVLKEHTKLIGAGISRTSIDQPVETVDSAAGTAILSQLRVPSVTWRVGRHSMIRNASVGALRASGSGGGRWFAAYPRLGGSSPSISVIGTNEPLHIYNMNVERVNSEPQSEIRSASNVFLYGVKGENNTTGVARGRKYCATVVELSGCRNVGLFTYCGVCRLPKSGYQLVKVADCEDVVAANINNISFGQGNGDTINLWKGTTKTGAIQFDDACAVLRSGRVDLVTTLAIGAGQQE
ncbi:MAG: glycosyl hydrolase family 28-related protein [Planctomycetota bacterium]